MPELVWDPTDFIECLEVLPEVEEYEISYGYEVSRSGIRLEVTVWPYDSAVALTICQDGSAVNIVNFVMFVRGKVRYVNDKRGEFLEFSDTVLAPTRFLSYREGDPFNRSALPSGLTLELRIKPGISIRLAQQV